MALEIKTIPVLTGEAAEKFLQAAEENEVNPRRERIRFSMEEIRQIANSGKNRLIHLQDGLNKS